MELKDKKIGFAMCGSFCTFKRALEALRSLADEGADLYPIMSEISYTTDTRFGSAKFFADEVESITGKKIIKSL